MFWHKPIAPLRSSSWMMARPTPRQRRHKSLAAAHPAEIRWLRIINSGPGSAREAGRRLARGSFIQHFDSDDLLHPHKFELQVLGLSKHLECAVAYGKTRFYRLGEHAADKPWKRTGDHVTMMFPSFLRERWWDTSTPLYRRELIDRAGAWTSLRQEEDWEYDCRIASQGVKLYNCCQFVSDTRDGRQSNSNGRTFGMLADRAKAHELILQVMPGWPTFLAKRTRWSISPASYFSSPGSAERGLKKESERLFQLGSRGFIATPSGGPRFSRLEKVARSGRLDGRGVARIPLG